MMRIVALFTLKPGVTREHYESWTRAGGEEPHWKMRG